GIAGFGRVEILRQRHGHASDAGTDVKHAGVGPKSALANEVSEELRADGAIIAIANEYAVRVGRRQKTVLQNRLHQPVDLRIRYCWFGFRFWLFQRYHIRQAALLSDLVMITFDRSTEIGRASCRV